MAKWMAKDVSTSTGTFIWNAANSTVAGYKAVASNQVASDLAYFGNWADLLIGYWGGMELIYDPYSRKQYGEIELCINVMVDVLARHAASFVVSTDSAAQ
jgi:hypothetical protein